MLHKFVLYKQQNTMFTDALNWCLKYSSDIINIDTNLQLMAAFDN